MDNIKLVLGSMTFGPQVSEDDSYNLIKEFLESGYNEIDTAYVYNDGDSEKILGSVLEDTTQSSISLATKIHPRITGKLDANAVYLQFNESLERLKRDSIDVLYFHFPDKNTPIESALNACNELYQAGKIKELGLSNFPSWMIVDIWHLCDKNGWLKPSIYEGRYNALSRNVEKELFPAIRKLKMRFYAYNPLAGGLLTGKHLSFEEVPEEGRFARLKSYRQRYWKKSFIDSINVLSVECRDMDIQPVEAAFRWLVHHSNLSFSDGDAIIMGASSTLQLRSNMLSVQKDPLPKRIIEAFDEAWGETKADSPEYFNFYSK